MPEHPKYLRDFSAKKSHLAVVAGSDMEDSTPISILTPCKVSLALIPAFLVEWYKSASGSRKKSDFLKSPQESTLPLKGRLTLLSGEFPPSQLLPTLHTPYLAEPDSDMELIQLHEECGQEMVSLDSPLTQCSCGSSMHRD